MAVAKRLRRALLAAVAIAGILLWLVALLLLSEAVENSDDFAGILTELIVINGAGITVLVVLIVVNITQLIKDHRRHVPGSRLRVRLVSLLVMIAVTPLLGVYLFTLEVVNRGIDNWFDLDLRDGLNLTLEYGKDLLEERKRERREQTAGFAARLAQLDETEQYARALSSMRAESNAWELTIFGTGNRIVATSVGAGIEAFAVPRQLSREMQLTQELDSVTAESSADGRWEIVAVVRIPRTDVGGTQYLQAVYPLEAGVSRVVNQIEGMRDRFASLQFIDDSLKLAFLLILSSVLLVSLLASVYGAFYFSRRLVVPIQQLMQGTRAVARGDFATRVPISARDEIGFLVNSFNDMTLRLAQASEAARLSSEQVERERNKLEVILARLSTGVVSLEADLSIRTANHAAGTILGLDLEACVGESLVALAADNPLLAQFLTVTATHFERGDREWREQLVLRGEGGRRVLMCACTELPGDADRPTGHVIVFDDITALLQAQRDAAWGEVARRLAHEIKNPLTPIQLSAERLRRKYLKQETAESDLLDRATHTIIQQVEAMKQMVNAFSEYARTPRMDVTTFDVNTLIREVAELYAHQERPIAVNLALSPALPPIEADAGRLRQVLHNLLRNAIEALEHQDSPRIDITTRRAQTASHDLIEITVADNGPGFLAEFLHQAFDPYVTSKPKGTGLGLAIVKKLVEEHGGQISARNRAQGGAEISILMPVSAETSVEAIHRRSDQRRERA